MLWLNFNEGNLVKLNLAKLNLGILWSWLNQLSPGLGESLQTEFDASAWVFAKVSAWVSLYLLKHVILVPRRLISLGFRGFGLEHNAIWCLRRASGIGCLRCLAVGLEHSAIRCLRREPKQRESLTFFLGSRSFGVLRHFGVITGVFNSNVRWLSGLGSRVPNLFIFHFYVILMDHARWLRGAFLSKATILGLHISFEWLARSKFEHCIYNFQLLAATHFLLFLGCWSLA